MHFFEIESLRTHFISDLFLLILLAAPVFSQVQPAGLGEKTYRINGIDLYTKTIGNGRPIIVLHGGPGLDHSYLLPQMGKLSDNYKLIFYDQRASGRSTGNIDTASITIHQFVDDLEGLRKALMLEKMDLFGHSWGGFLAMEYAIAYPQRVNSIVLACPMGADSNWVLPFLQARTVRTTHEDTVSLARLFATQEFAEQDPKIIAEYIRLLYKAYFYNRSLADSLTITFTQRTASDIFPIFTIFFRQLQRYDIRPQIAVLTCPTLIIHGDYDPILPQYAEDIHTSIKGSQYVLLKNCGHFPFVESPEIFFKACMDFWSAAVKN